MVLGMLCWYGGVYGSYDFDICVYDLSIPDDFYKFRIICFITCIENSFSVFGSELFGTFHV